MHVCIYPFGQYYVMFYDLRQFQSFLLHFPISPTTTNNSINLNNAQSQMRPLYHTQLPKAQGTFRE